MLELTSLDDEQVLCEYNRTVTRICGRPFRPTGEDAALDADRDTLRLLVRELIRRENVRPS